MCIIVFGMPKMSSWVLYHTLKFNFFWGTPPPDPQLNPDYKNPRSTRSWPHNNLPRDRERRPFGARGRSSGRYGTRLGDLKESWFILFSN